MYLIMLYIYYIYIICFCNYFAEDLKAERQMRENLEEELSFFRGESDFVTLDSNGRQA